MSMILQILIFVFFYNIQTYYTFTCFNSVHSSSSEASQSAGLIMDLDKARLMLDFWG